MQELSSAAVIDPAATGLSEAKSGFTGISHRSRLSLKRGFDVGMVLTALLLFFPLLLLVVALIYFAQGRPIFIRHHRVGKNGVMFPCMKFRTMMVNGDEILRAHIASDQAAGQEWLATRKLKNDPRITPLGHVLRKLSVDELPQLINVLRGEMSLVGPRPIVPDEMHYYGAQINLYQTVRPGLTGSWQVGGRNDVSYSKRVKMDAEYVMNWSLSRDLTILVKTIPAVMTSRGCY